MCNHNVYFAQIKQKIVHQIKPKTILVVLNIKRKNLKLNCVLLVVISQTTRKELRISLQNRTKFALLFLRLQSCTSCCFKDFPYSFIQFGRTFQVRIGSNLFCHAPPIFRLHGLLLALSQFSSSSFIKP